MFAIIIIICLLLYSVRSFLYIQFYDLTYGLSIGMYKVDTREPKHIAMIIVIAHSEESLNM